MKLEIDSAANFINGLMRSRLTESDLAHFTESFRSVLSARYSDHWFPDKPFKGSAFRCIRIVKRRLDPVLALAATGAGLTESALLDVLPSELTLWVDPADVCYRFGEDGSIGNLYSGADDDSDDSVTSSDSESSFNSPSPSPQPTAPISLGSARCVDQYQQHIRFSLAQQQQQAVTVQ